MRKYLFLISFCLLSVALHAQSFNLATYNLRYANTGDSLDLWKNRYPVMADLIRFNNFGIFGTQEGLYAQLNDLKAALPGYDFIGRGRDDGEHGGEHSAIFYKTDRFKLLDKGDFWLSTDMNKPNKGWDAVCNRICSWGKFEDMNSHFVFYMFNVHFDHKGEVARRESARLILDQMSKIAGKTPAILSGDFNLDETHESYALIQANGLLKDAYTLADVRFAPNGTFNGFDVNAKPKGRIDHIFLTRQFQVVRYGILTNTYNGRFPSDHFPVLIEVKLKK